jgi:hypothetical protein
VLSYAYTPNYNFFVVLSYAYTPNMCLDGNGNNRFSEACKSATECYKYITLETSCLESIAYDRQGT